MLQYPGGASCLSEMSLNPKVAASIAIDSEATVSEAIAKLVQNNIGSLPVVDHGGHLVGIFSERDVLRVIHNRGEGFGRLRVADVMTGHPVTCHLDDDVNDVMGKMSERHIAKVPVLSDTSSWASSRSETSSRFFTTRFMPRTSI